MVTMRTLVAVLVLAGCVDVEVIEPSIEQHADVSGDGFGFRCFSSYQPESLVTYCTPRSGAEGICDVGICHRRCPGDYPDHGCPTGEWAEPVVGKDANGRDHCICLPMACRFYSEMDGRGPAYANCYAADIAP